MLSGKGGDVVFGRCNFSGSGNIIAAESMNMSQVNELAPHPVGPVQDLTVRMDYDSFVKWFDPYKAQYIDFDLVLFIQDKTFFRNLDLSFLVDLDASNVNLSFCFGTFEKNSLSDFVDSLDSSRSGEKTPNFSDIDITSFPRKIYNLSIVNGLVPEAFKKLEDALKSDLFDKGEFPKNRGLLQIGDNDY